MQRGLSTAFKEVSFDVFWEFKCLLFGSILKTSLSVKPYTNYVKYIPSPSTFCVQNLKSTNGAPCDLISRRTLSNIQLLNFPGEYHATKNPCQGKT
jgi:hypothetical protein